MKTSSNLDQALKLCTLFAWLRAKSSYTYTDENPKPRKLPERDEAGKPRTKDKNCTTNPISKVETEFFKKPGYMSDPYDRKKDQDKKDR